MRAASPSDAPEACQLATASFEQALGDRPPELRVLVARAGDPHRPAPIARSDVRFESVARTRGPFFVQRAEERVKLALALGVRFVKDLVLDELGELDEQLLGLEQRREGLRNSPPLGRGARARGARRRWPNAARA